jgi:hypothetical protein
MNVQYVVIVVVKGQKWLVYPGSEESHALAVKASYLKSHPDASVFVMKLTSEIKLVD